MKYRLITWFLWFMALAIAYQAFMITVIDEMEWWRRAVVLVVLAPAPWGFRFMFSLIPALEEEDRKRREGE